MKSFEVRFFFFAVVLAVLTSCSTSSGEQFQVRSAERTHLNFSNQLTSTDSLNSLDYLYFYNGGGVALGDINNDGLVDVFFTSNQESNRLFLNKGNLEFEDISQKAGIGGAMDWSTGVTMADVNGDGFLDIHVCAVVGIHGLKGHNELYINNGDLTFTEASKTYGLDYQNFSTQAAFFDYDADGDLDMYLLNHAIHTPESFGKVSQTRHKRTQNTGDKLLQNENGVFIDVSERAGIYGGLNGFGLGLATADFNGDHWVDIYVSNDFYEDDFLYLNDGGKGFKLVTESYLGQSSRFSMGSDVADLNGDGYPEVFTLDMLPQEEKVLKTTMSDESYKVRQLKENMGYHHQSARNMLQVNRNGQGFMEMSMISGVYATDWSWSALFADYDLDGINDLFVSNGIVRRPNDLDYIKFISNDIVKRAMNTSNDFDQKAIAKMPEGAARNYFFQGAGDLLFQNETGHWVEEEAGVSTGAAYADLDNDGDLDLVVNNTNRTATLYENTTQAGHYLKLKFLNSGENTHGIGTKVYAYTQGQMQYQQLFTSRGFQSSSEPLIHFGLGANQKIDSLHVVWPDHTMSRLTNVASDTLLVLNHAQLAKTEAPESAPTTSNAWFIPTSLAGLIYQHEEDDYNDFDHESLIPYKVSDRGARAAVSDVDGNGMEDVFIGNAEGAAARLFLQSENGFESLSSPLLQRDAFSEVTDVCIADFNNDGKQDIYAVNGGGAISKGEQALKDHFYTFSSSIIKDAAQKLPDLRISGSVVAPADYDGDGDLDLFVGAHIVPGHFGELSDSYLLNQENGEWAITKQVALADLGMVTDALWTDFDADGRPDLIIVGEWMAPKWLKNDDGRLTDVTELWSPGAMNGLWQVIEPYDMDGDGTTEYLIGNWGLNNKFEVSAQHPLRMYYDDFDRNGTAETLLSHWKDDRYYPINTLDELAGQMKTLIRKKFPSYASFAGRSLKEIMGTDLLEQADLFELHTLKSGYLKKVGAQYEFFPFDPLFQLAPITEILIHDFDGDQLPEALLAGNYKGVSPYHGYMQEFTGGLLDGENRFLSSEVGLDLSGKVVSDLDIIQVGNQKFLLVTLQNMAMEIYLLNSK